MGAPGLGAGGCCVWDLGNEGRAPTAEETEREDIRRHYSAHTIVIFSHAQLIFFAASSSQGESLPGQSCWIGFDRGMGMMSSHISAVS